MRAAILALSGAAMLAVAAASGCSQDDSFDYLQLVLQWPPVDCQTFGSCTGNETQAFTIHGLWPDDNNGNYPCYCTNEQFDPTTIASFRSSMDYYWASLSSSTDESFWSHEWTKHGTCATYNGSIIASQKTFFQTTLSLRNKYDLLPALASAGITPSNNKQISISSVMAAFNNQYGASMVPACDVTGYLSGYSVCLDRTLQAFDCPSSSNPCSSSVIFPATSS